MSQSFYDLSNSGIYNIINTVSLKHYIGSAVRFSKRWAEHRSNLNDGKHKNKHLQSSWNKYGSDAFEFSVIEYVNDKTQLTKIEQLYIDAYFATGTLYNTCPTAGSKLGCKVSEETRRKVSNSTKGIVNKGRKHTEEELLKMRESHKNQKPSDACKNALSVALRGNTWNVGRKHSEETRRKQSERQTGNKHKPHKQCATRATTFEGSPCRRCGTTVRYMSVEKRCVRCRLGRVI